MFDYEIAKNTGRSTSALEIAMQARIREREMALLAGEYKGRKPGSKKKNFLQALIASLFLG